MSEWKDRIGIQFVFRNEPYAYRSWRVVPRVNDEVMLRHEGQKKAFMVTRVVWGVESDEEEDLGRQSVNIEVTLAKDTQ